MVRRTQQRDEALERLRQSHEKEAKEHDKETRAEWKAGMVSLLDQNGKPIGWIRPVGNGRASVPDVKSAVATRGIDARTFNPRSGFAG